MAVSQKTPLRGDALKENVLGTALELFSERGYFNTSIHDIRRAAGVSTGAIYHHFRNKEALAEALYRTLLQQIDLEIEEACLGKVGCLDRSRAIIERLFALTRGQPRDMQFILLAQHREYLPGEPPICSSKPFQQMKRVVAEGITNKEVRDMEPWVAATSMFGGALRMMNLYLDGVLERPLDEYVDEVVDCAWRGIKA
jgi:TetR/AcrR family transcriptional regulator, repressor of fatR-cypB operon